MLDFYNVTEDDRIAFINRNSKMLKDLSRSISLAPTEDETIEAILGFEKSLYIGTCYSVLKRDIGLAKMRGSESYKEHQFNCGYNHDNPEVYIKNASALTEELANLEPKRIFAGPSASSYLKLSKNWSNSVSMERLGIHKSGYLIKDNIGSVDIYTAPSLVIPANSIIVELNTCIIEYELKGLKDFENTTKGDE